MQIRRGNMTVLIGDSPVPSKLSYAILQVSLSVATFATFRTPSLRMRRRVAE